MHAHAERWAFQESGNTVEVDTDRTGQLARWVVGGKTLVDSGPSLSPLQLTSSHGEVREFKAASFAPAPQGQPGVTVSGILVGTDGKQIPATLSYRILDGGAGIVVGLDVPKLPGDLSVEKFSWTLPLSLNPRKRVFFLSDYGLEWDTRYFFQLTFDPGSGKGKVPSLLAEPDRTEWRYFGLDQFGPQGYRLWKSESDTTMPLVMHEGKSPAPIVQVYDEQGGVTLEYPGLKDSQPRSLRVDASAGGSISVLFQPDSSAPGTGRSEALSHEEIQLTAQSSEKSVHEKQAALLKQYASSFSQPIDPQSALQEPEWVVRTPLESDGPAYVVGGYPFARGVVRDLHQVAVTVAGAKVPVQSRELAYWPDGSLKWVLLTFPIDIAAGVDNCPPPRISLRNGKFLPVKIDTAEAPSVSASGTLAVQQQTDGTVAISNGDLKLELGTGEQWMRRLEYRGNVLVDAALPDKRATAYCNFLDSPSVVLPFAMRAEAGTPDHGILRVDKVEIEQSGPFRSIVRLEGLTTNREPTRIIMRLEFLAGRPEVRIAHTSVFRFKDPRRTFLTGLGLEFPLPDGTKAAGQVIALVQDTSVHQHLDTDGQASPSAKSAHSLRVSGPSLGLTAIIRNFRETAPKALNADLRTGRFQVELWPTEAPPMDVRRYSNFLHEGMLESPIQYPTPPDWVSTAYYESDPFYGVSRTHEVLLAFDDGKTIPDGESLAADFQSPPLLYAGWEKYADSQVTLPSSSEQAWPRAWAAWTRLAEFFLYHREMHKWYGFWNFGDFRHRFRGGFGWTHPPKLLADLVKGTVADDAAKMQSLRKLDYVPANDWNFDNGAYGWSNTEGLPGLFLQSEYLRHGNRVIYFAAEAIGRYARDVITRQEGRWFGKGTRHGVQPWSDGNHEARQTTVTEYRLLYFLSGDGRSREVADHLYRQSYLKDEVKSRADHSARLGGFLFHWEMTGDPAEGERLGRYVSQFISDDGIYLEPQVKFPEATAGGEPKMLNEGSMFFHTFGGMHALLEYQQITGDEKLSAALIHMADAIIKKPIIEKGTLGSGDYSWPPVAFAALHASDPEPYRAFLRHYLEKGGWRNAYQPVTVDPKLWTGPAAFMANPVALSFFWANWAPYVTDAIGDKEFWTPEIEKDFATWENRQPAFRATSWQSDYDQIPEIQPLLAPQQPWRALPASSPKK